MSTGHPLLCFLMGDTMFPNTDASIVLVSPLRWTVSLKTGSQIKFFYLFTFVRYRLTVTRTISHTINNT